MAIVAGIAYFKIDGVQYALRANLKVFPGNRELESAIGLDGSLHGFIHQTKVAAIEADITDNATLDIKKLGNLENVTVTAELINGKAYVLRNASQVKSPELNATDGMISIRFEGASMEEIL